jgi:hypothetical protein
MLLRVSFFLVFFAYIPLIMGMRSNVVDHVYKRTPGRSKGPENQRNREVAIYKMRRLGRGLKRSAQRWFAFLNWEGVIPVNFLKARLKAALVEKPASKAAWRMEVWFMAESESRLFTSLTR